MERKAIVAEYSEIGLPGKVRTPAAKVSPRISCMVDPVATAPGSDTADRPFQLLGRQDL